MSAERFMVLNSMHCTFELHLAIGQMKAIHTVRKTTDFVVKSVVFYG